MIPRILASLCFALAAAATADPADPTAVEFFEREVRPILAEQCFECHGPEQQKSGLRLDHLQFIDAGGDTGPVLLRDNAAESRLLRAIHYEDVDLQMPPAGKLPAVAIAAIEKWVSLGAPWPDEPVPGATSAVTPFDLEARRNAHWVWQPLRQAAPPAAAEPAWNKSDIDRFLYAALRKEDLTPAPPADRYTLLRRASFDLIGLPPAPEAVQQFVEDESPEAFAKVVDNLLASPHFGERWGRHWLDLVRYAETFGHEQDFPIPQAWKYRDYVIRALNEDLPYDQFVREQIAGDLLPDPRLNQAQQTNESILGTGFWYMHQATHSPVDVQQDGSDRIDNQIDVFSKAFLGLTVACARCHDHKFDAISAKDYYALAGFLRSSRQDLAFIGPALRIQQRVAALEKIQTDLQEQLQRQGPQRVQFAAAELPAYLKGANAATPAPAALNLEQLQRWVDALSEPQPQYAAISMSKNPAPARIPEDRTHFDQYASWLPSGPAFAPASVSSASIVMMAGRPHVVPSGAAHSARLSRKLQGVLRSPSFTIDHDNIYFLAAGTHTKIRLIIEGYQLREYSALLFEDTLLNIDAGGTYRWYAMSDDVRKHKGCRAYLEFVDEGDGYLAVDQVVFSDGPMPNSNAVPLRLQHQQAEAEPEALFATWTKAAFDNTLAGTADAFDAGLLNWLFERDLLPTQADQMQLNRLANEEAALPAPERALAMADGSPEDQHVFLRGSYKTPGELAQRRFLEAIDGPQALPFSQGSGRLELAERLLSSSNALPVRVLVNRIWQHLFGRGIVPTPDNFGVLGEPPTHPELLDYLAAKFMREGWSLKKLIREIMLTSAYQMSSQPTDPAAEARDPANRLLHRMNLRRLEGEPIRDAMLALSGRLDATIGGPSVPIYLSDFMSMSRRPAVSGPLDGAGRRSVYVEVRRNFLSPMLLAFDMPLPDTTLGRRTVSNVPAQALTLMNDAFVLEQARLWGEKMAAAPGTMRERMEAAWLQALGRPPVAEELRMLKEFSERQAQLYGTEAIASDPKVWADLCHLLFTLKEFIFVP